MRDAVGQAALAPVGGRTVGGWLSAATAALRESGSPSPRLDAELLLGHALGIDRAGLIAAHDIAVGVERASEFIAALERRRQGEPVAYIRGIKEFYGLAFSVDRRALIPRPETERLVELALERVRDALTGRPRPAGSPPLGAWDIGTGSGAIAVSLAAECRRRGYAAELRVLATDISADALALATENAVGHGVADTVSLRRADLAALGSGDAAEWLPVDLVCANLPYVPSPVLPTLPVAASFEPHDALDGGPDGLDVIRRLLPELPRVLAVDGTALLEIGADQADALIAAAAQALPGWPVVIHADLAGLPRVAELLRGTAGGHATAQAGR
jgi:release factor glutamine methyltransferase